MNRFISGVGDAIGTLICLKLALDSYSSNLKLYCLDRIQDEIKLTLKRVHIGPYCARAIFDNVMPL